MHKCSCMSLFLVFIIQKVIKCVHEVEPQEARERERKRERGRELYIYIYVCVCVCIYLYEKKYSGDPQTPYFAFLLRSELSRSFHV